MQKTAKNALKMPLKGRKKNCGIPILWALDVLKRGSNPESILNKP